MTVEAEYERYSLPLSDPFSIARGTQEYADTVVVQITDGDGRTGIGGAAPSAHYGETIETVIAVLPELFEVVSDLDDPYQLDAIERRLKERLRGNPAARTAVSIALHDLVARRLDVPLYRYFGLDPEESVETSYTIGLDSTKRMIEKTEEAVEAGHSVLKVKLGTNRDIEIVDAIRETAPEATIRVDANEAWTPHQAVSVIEELAGYDVEFVEQPVPAENPENLKFVYDRSALPIAADESCIQLSDVPAIADRADIANIKLMKCGGLREALRMIHTARAHGLEVMLGCMIESNASIAAGAHLAPLLDYTDLDGSLLLAEDPFEGVAFPGGQIDLVGTSRNGTGARQA